MVIQSALSLNGIVCLRIAFFDKIAIMSMISFILMCLAVRDLGPVVQSVVSLTNSLRVISLTVLADSKYNILIFFAEKM